MRVVGLYVYPVTSLAGVAVESVAFGPSGTIVGDRAWALQDAYSGVVLSCTREPRLLYLGTSAAGGEVLVHVPGVDSPVPIAECADVVSPWLGRQVRPLLLGRAPTSPLFDSAFPVETGFGSLAEHGGCTHVITTGTVRLVSTLCMQLGEPQSDEAATLRLRPNIVVAEDSTFAEDNWSGATLTGAQVALRVVEGAGICTVVDFARPGMPATSGLLERLRTDHGAVAGSYVVGGTGDRLCLGDILRVSW